MTQHTDYLAQARASNEKRHQDEVDAQEYRDHLEEIQRESVRRRLNELFGDLSEDMWIMSVVESPDEYVWFASIGFSSAKHKLGFITFVLRHDDRTNLPWEVDEGGYTVYRSSYVTWLSTGEWIVTPSMGFAVEDFVDALSFALDSYREWDADQKEANRRNTQGIRPDEPNHILSIEDRLILALKTFIDYYTENDPR